MGGVKCIFLLRLIILARLLTPEDFGLLAIAATTLALLLSVTNFGMIPALVQGANMQERHYNTAWTVGLSRALLISLIVIATAPWIAQIFAEPRATPIIQALALRPILDALASIKIASLTRELEFRSLTMAKLIDAIANTFISISLVYMLGVWALVAGALAGSMAYLAVSYWVAPHRPRIMLDYAAAQSLIQFGRWIFLTSLIVMAGTYVLRVVISRQLGVADLGLYFLGAQLAFLPAEIASEVVAAVAFPLFARLQSDISQAKAAFRAILVGVSALLFPICALLIVFAPTLVHDILGPQWSGTIPVIRVLALAGLIGIFGEVTITVLQGFGQPYRVTILEVIQSLSIIALAWVLTSHYGLVGAALSWLPAIILSFVINIVFIRQLLPDALTGLHQPFAAIISATVIGAAFAFFMDGMVSGIFGLIIISLLTMIIVAVLLWVLDRRFSFGLVDDLKRAFPQITAWISKPIGR